MMAHDSSYGKKGYVVLNEWSTS